MLVQGPFVRQLLTAILLVIAGWGGQARGSAVELFGFGARGTAMGGAVATTSDGFEAVYYNPAALTLARNLSVNVGM